jgi:hypothetical protein
MRKAHTTPLMLEEAAREAVDAIEQYQRRGTCADRERLNLIAHNLRAALPMQEAQAAIAKVEEADHAAT